MRRDERDEPLEVEVIIKALTAKAILVELESGDEQWVPLSCVDLNATNVQLERGAEGTLAIARWFAVKEGLAE